MKQNVPYKPLSSHAATRQVNTPTTDEPASHSFQSKDTRTVTATVDEQRKIVKIRQNFQHHNFEAHDPLDDNLFFADIDAGSGRKPQYPSKLISGNASGHFQQEYIDETHYDSGSHQKINVPYFDSFGKKGQLDEMVLRDQVKDSAIFNISESQQLNFTFGNSAFQKALLQNNSSMVNSQVGQIQDARISSKQRETVPQKSSSQGQPDPSNETPPHSQRSQRIKIPIKIVSSAGKLTDTNKSDSKPSLSANPQKPPRHLTTKRPDQDQGLDRERSHGKTIAAQLRPEKLVVRTPNNS